ncbi:unnamed protein product [Linum tenue]|uniref:Mitochondrial ribosomal protein S21 n=1 Tax=Linum tenue TaxID=586396 RepID=A0AAV0HZ18_9ROSI|nr:unnamed protein product [Linum tenue]
MMNWIRSSASVAAASLNSLVTRESQLYRTQQWRGIRVTVYDGNVERALTVLQRKMQSSGMERLIKRAQTTHLKNSEKRVLAHKNLMHRVKSEDLARKLQGILQKKIRGTLRAGIGWHKSDCGELMSFAKHCWLQ